MLSQSVTKIIIPIFFVFYLLLIMFIYYCIQTTKLLIEG